MDSKKPRTEEEIRALTTKRMISDGQLLQNGADIKLDGWMEISGEQIDDARRMMEQEMTNKDYADSTVNGNTQIKVRWSEEYRCYIIDFKEPGVYQNQMLIGQGEDIAKEIFQYATNLQKKTGKELYEGVRKYIEINGDFKFNIDDHYWDLDRPIDYTDQFARTTRPKKTNPLYK